MRKFRFYYPQPITIGQQVLLGASQHQHLTKVLRAQVGQNIYLFTGDGFEYVAKIIEIQRQTTKVEIITQDGPQALNPINIELNFALIKFDNIDYILQKCTELGVNSFRPILTENCSIKNASTRFNAKFTHFNNIIISACAQSRRNTLPSLKYPISFNELFTTNADLKFIVHPRELIPVTLQKHIVNLNNVSAHSPNNLQILIGPEGGFNTSEVELALANDFQVLSLGPRILRAETAAIAVCALLQGLWGDWC